MLARGRLRHRIDDTLAVASPLALARAMDAHIAGQSPQGVRRLIDHSMHRMQPAEREQLGLFVHPDDPDDALAVRFSTFLRQNPRAISTLDPAAVKAILAHVGAIEAPRRARRMLALRAGLIVAAVLTAALLPLTAQYVHQRAFLAALDRAIMPAPVAPFVEIIGTHAPAARPSHRPARRVLRRPVHHAPAAALVAMPLRVARVPRPVPKSTAIRHVTWKFDRRNNPYFNPVRWRHPYIAPDTRFGARARLAVDSYLRALIAGNVPAALAHLGLPANADRTALSEMPIVRRTTRVAIAGSMTRTDGTAQVQVDIVTGGREYYEVFHVGKDGPAMRILDRYYIPVNHRAQLAARRLLVQRRY